MSKRRPQLDPRHRPTQPRALATVSRLLDATATLLERDGLEALTTNKIAAEAGVNVASLYKYFPNKYAVLQALSERNLDRQREIIGEAIGDIRDWRQAVSKGLDVFIEYYLTEPASAELADAFRTIPVLRDQELEGSFALRSFVSQRLAELGAQGSKKELEAMGQVVVESSAAVLNLARLAPRGERKLLLTQLKRMITGFMETVIGDVSR